MIIFMLQILISTVIAMLGLITLLVITAVEASLAVFDFIYCLLARGIRKLGSVVRDALKRKSKNPTKALQSRPRVVVGV